MCCLLRSSNRSWSQSITILCNELKTRALIWRKLASIEPNFDWVCSQCSGDFKVETSSNALKSWNINTFTHQPWSTEIGRVGWSFKCVGVEISNALIFLPLDHQFPFQFEFLNTWGDSLPCFDVRRHEKSRFFSYSSLFLILKHWPPPRRFCSQVRDDKSLLFLFLVFFASFALYGCLLCWEDRKKVISFMWIVGREGSSEIRIK